MSEDDQEILDRVMDSVRHFWPQIDVTDIEIDLEGLYAKLATLVRRTRKQSVGLLDQCVKELIERTVAEGVESRDMVDHVVCAQILKDSADGCFISATAKDLYEIAMDMIAVSTNDAFAVVSNEEERRANLQEVMRFLLQKARRESFKRSSEAILTLEWLENSLRSALAARDFCQSVISGHTGSVLETVCDGSSQVVTVHLIHHRDCYSLAQPRPA